MRTNLCLLAIALFVCLVQATDFGGVYQIVTYPKPECLYGNQITNECSCPDGFVPQCLYATLDSYQKDSNICFCEPKELAKGQGYGGVYEKQIDDCDGAPCLVPNRYTQKCECEPGYTNISLGLVNVGAACQDAFDAPVSACVLDIGPSASTSFFGGYEITPMKVCMFTNNFTNACSCPPSTTIWEGRGTCDGTNFRCYTNNTFMDPPLIVCWVP